MQYTKNLMISFIEWDPWSPAFRQHTNNGSMLSVGQTCPWRRVGVSVIRINAGCRCYTWSYGSLRWAHLDRNTWGLFYWHGLALIPAWISNHKSNKEWDEITYPFSNLNGCTVKVPNFNGCTIEVWKWISYFISRYSMDVITFSCL